MNIKCEYQTRNRHVTNSDEERNNEPIIGNKIYKVWNIVWKSTKDDDMHDGWTLKGILSLLSELYTTKLYAFVSPLCHWCMIRRLYFYLSNNFIGFVSSTNHRERYECFPPSQELSTAKSVTEIHHRVLLPRRHPQHSTFGVIELYTGD